MLVLGFTSIGAACFLVLLVWRYLQFRTASSALRAIPGYHVALSLWGISLFMPKIPFVSLGHNYLWVNAYSTYQDLGWQVYKIVSFWGVEKWILTSDPEVVKEVTTHRARYPKALDMVRILGFYGKNMFVVEGADWTVHRKATNPTFTEKNLRLVWRESLRLLDEMFESWESKDVIRIDNVTKLTTRFSLLVIAGAGFGSHIAWQEQPSGERQGHHRMSFPEALLIVADDLWIRLSIPGPFWGTVEDRNTFKVGGLAGRGWLGKRVKRTAVAFAELRSYMTEMIEEKKEYAHDEEHCDLFTNLVRATEAEKIGPGLDHRGLEQDELLGSVYAYLIAGADTCGHTLAFSLGLLALYQDVQERVYQSVVNALPSNRPPLYDDLSSLNLALAVFYETLRLYPPGPGLAKMVEQETIMSVRPVPDNAGSNGDEDTKTVVLPAGTYVVVNVPAVHMNPRVWEDPWTFKPERFLKDWPKDSFLGFAAGPRTCIGRKFAESEGVAFLSQLLRHYRVCVDEEKFPDIPGESPQDRRSRLLSVKMVLTLTATHVPLKFVRR